MSNVTAIKNGIVVNVVAVTAETRAQTKAYFQATGHVCVDDSTASTGDSWDGDAFTPPMVEEPTERYISGLQYLRRFSQEQRIAIRALAETDFIAKDIVHLLDSTIAQGGQVNLLDQDNVNGVAYLAAMLPGQNIDAGVILA